MAFQSAASNLVAGDTNAVADIFVHDRQTGQTTRVSVDSSGIEGNGASNFSSISQDGRYVAFHSSASNLAELGDFNGAHDVFVHDRQTGKTTRVSVDSSGTTVGGGGGSPSISADGRYVAFASTASDLVMGDTNASSDIFVHDRQTGVTMRASMDRFGTQGNEVSYYPSINADGRYVAFHSTASNLVTEDTNAANDVFVRQMQAFGAVQNDFDGDGISDIAVWRPSTGVWYIMRSSDGGMTAVQWGSSANNDVPVPGDYDGDGKIDIVVWRPASGIWYIYCSSDGEMTAVQWGAPTDVPIR